MKYLNSDGQSWLFFIINNNQLITTFTDYEIFNSDGQTWLFFIIIYNAFKTAFIDYEIFIFCLNLTEYLLSLI